MKRRPLILLGLLLLTQGLRPHSRRFRRLFALQALLFTHPGKQFNGFDQHLPKPGGLGKDAK